MSSGEKYYPLDGDDLLYGNRTIPEKSKNFNVDPGFNISNIDIKTLNELDKCCNISSATNLKGLRITPNDNWKGGVLIDGNIVPLDFFEIGKEIISITFIDKHTIKGKEVFTFETTGKNGAVTRYMFYSKGVEI